MMFISTICLIMVPLIGSRRHHGKQNWNMMINKDLTHEKTDENPGYFYPQEEIGIFSRPADEEISNFKIDEGPIYFNTDEESNTVNTVEPATVPDTELISPTMADINWNNSCKCGDGGSGDGDGGNVFDSGDAGDSGKPTTDSLEIPIETASYTCALLMGTSRSCSCAIIKERVVITSAHCVNGLQPRPNPIQTGYSKQLIKVGVGLNYNSNEEYRRHRRDKYNAYHQTSAVKIHENFTSIDQGNDIALILLLKPLEITEKVTPIEIIDRLVLDEELVYITGYGLNMPGWDSIDSVNRPLRGHYYGIINQDECAQQWAFTMNDNFICIKANEEVKRTGSEVDPCYGDSGGPVVSLCDTPVPSSASQLIGMFSFIRNDTCTLPTSPPPIYTGLYNYREWINTSINELLSAEKEYFHRVTSEPSIGYSIKWFFKQLRKPFYRLLKLWTNWSIFDSQ